MAAPAFRQLWRTQRAVFGGDAAAGALARARIRAEFRKNVGATPEQAKELIAVRATPAERSGAQAKKLTDAQTAVDTSKLARATVLQARLDPKSGRYRARVERFHALGREAHDDGT